MRLDPIRAIASIDGVHRNVSLPPRSTGGLIAEGLRQTSIPRPAAIEAFNVESGTAAALGAGGTGPGTRIGTLLEDVAGALGGIVTRWEPSKDGKA